MSDLISVKTLDENGLTDNWVYFVESGHTLADLTARVQSDVLDADGVIGGQITAAYVTASLALPGGLKAAPVVGARKAIGANLLFDMGLRHKHTIRLPMIDPTFLSGKQISNAGLLAALHAALLVTINTVDLVDANDNPLTAFLSVNQANRTK